jgi:hypothetical protein
MRSRGRLGMAAGPHRRSPPSLAIRGASIGNIWKHYRDIVTAMALPDIQERLVALGHDRLPAPEAIGMRMANIKVQ